MAVGSGAAAIVAGAIAFIAGRAGLVGGRRPQVVQIVSSVGLALLLEGCALLRGDQQLALAAAWGVFAAVIVVQVGIDLRTRTLPRRISYAGLLVVGALMASAGTSEEWVQLIVGAVLMTAITGVLLVASRGSLGIGDLHFSPILGLAIGWFAPSLVVLAWIVASITAAGLVIVLLATGRISRRTRIPYGPFLALGTMAAICVGAVR